ncbi:hypothetical protein BX070DRAFT_130632 [Coemansia spiralis]|nr:hypothetical protein BX070DRAFT_130632 [Coemansia spiralis]
MMISAVKRGWCAGLAGIDTARALPFLLFHLICFPIRSVLLSFFYIYYTALSQQTFLFYSFIKPLNFYQLLLTVMGFC